MSQEKPSGEGPVEKKKIIGLKKAKDDQDNSKGFKARYDQDNSKGFKARYNRGTGKGRKE